MKEFIEGIEMRAKLVLDNLRPHNSGDSIHLVENMRAAARLLIDGVKSGKVSHDVAHEQIKALEDKHLEFIKERMKSWTKT